MSDISICLDLGNDSLKVSYGVKSHGRIYFGKIVEDTIIPQSVMNSSAFFDTENKKWIFGTEIDKTSAESLSTIVKIKDLLSLLLNTGDDAIDERNKYFYNNGHDFPLYFFPNNPELDNPLDFKEKVDKDFTFKDYNKTPKEVCRDYFVFISNIVNKKIEKICEKYQISSYYATPTINMVYPSMANKAYINELKSLIEFSFMDRIYKCLNITRCLAIYARYQNKLLYDDSFLVFDIGNESISVSKATYSKNNIVLVDGIDGHSPYKKIGGNDIDAEIYKLIENKIGKRETPGTPHYGENGHINEKSLISKQYLLLKNIKKAKMILSGDYGRTSVTLDIAREVNVQVTATKDEIISCINKAAPKFIEYIINELKLGINKKVTKIFISGGTVESFGLVDEIKKSVFDNFGDRIKVFTFERENNEYSDLGIGDNEDSTYSPSMACNYCAIENIDVPLCLSLSYASFLYSSSKVYGRQKRLSFFANKGDVLNLNKPTTFSTKVSHIADGRIKEEIFSLEITDEDVENRLVNGYIENGKYYIFEIGTDKRRQAIKDAGMKTVAGGNDKSLIKLYYAGREISHIYGDGHGTDGIFFKEGINVDENGHSVPFIENAETVSRTLRINYFSGQSAFVSSTSIDIRFEGVESFNASKAN